MGKKLLREAQVSGWCSQGRASEPLYHPQLPKKQVKDCPCACGEEGAAVRRGVPTSLYGSPLHGSRHTRPEGLRQRPSVSPTLTHSVWHSLTSPTLCVTDHCCLCASEVQPSKTSGLFVAGFSYVLLALFGVLSFYIFIKLSPKTHTVTLHSLFLPDRILTSHQERPISFLIYRL